MAARDEGRDQQQDHDEEGLVAEARAAMAELASYPSSKDDHVDCLRDRLLASLLELDQANFPTATCTARIPRTWRASST